MSMVGSLECILVDVHLPFNKLQSIKASDIKDVIRMLQNHMKTLELFYMHVSMGWEVSDFECLLTFTDET